MVGVQESKPQDLSIVTWHSSDFVSILLSMKYITSRSQERCIPKMCLVGLLERGWQLVLVGMHKLLCCLQIPQPPTQP